MIHTIYKSLVKRILIALILGVLAFFVIEVIMNIRFRYYDLFYKPLNYLYSCLLSVLMLELIIFQNKILENKYPWHKNPFRHFWLQVIFNASTVTLIMAVFRPLVLLIIQPGRLYTLSNEIWNLAVILLFALTLNLAELILYLSRSYRAALLESEKFKKEMAEAQFEMLRMQVNPHFLFNSLNTLVSVIQEDTVKAVDFVRKLSDVYRYTLDSRQTEITDLKEELDFIESYLYLLMIRFHEMLTCHINIPEKFKQSKIPPLTLQMLIENAVKHNILSKKRPLVIDIFIEEDMLVVRNNYQPKEREVKRSGLGLRNIRNRYAYLTERQVIIDEDGEYFTVKIPLILYNESTDHRR